LKNIWGATAMVAIGCGGDANPSPGDFEHVNQHAVMIAEKIDKPFRPISSRKNNIPVK
jgi:hypothetical protein